MSYIGRSPVIGNFTKLDAISVVNGQAAYTMQNGSVNFTNYSSVNQFMVSLNSVVQSPGSSFTVSGSTITFASNLVTGDVIDFIIVFGNSLSAGVPTDDTVSTAKIVDGAVTNSKVASSIITGQTAETSIATDDLILLSDTSASGALKKMTRANFVSGIGGTNTPAFMAYNAANQSISDTTVTQITWTESYDSDNAFASNTFTVPSGEGGKYWIGTNVQVYNDAGNISMFIVYVQVNGSQAMYIREHVDSNAWYQKGINVNGILNLSAGDAVTVSVYIDFSSGSTQVNDDASETFFTGYKLIT